MVVVAYWRSLASCPQVSPPHPRNAKQAPHVPLLFGEGECGGASERGEGPRVYRVAGQGEGRNGRGVSPPSRRQAAKTKPETRLEEKTKIQPEGQEANLDSKATFFSSPHASPSSHFGIAGRR